MSSDQNIATIMHLIKGESAYWANRNLQLQEKFGWQDEYFAVSISESHFSRVYDYISNQELHHARKTFQQEYDEFVEKYRFEGLKPCPKCWLFYRSLKATAINPNANDNNSPGIYAGDTMQPFKLTRASAL
jgi:hypothetical protein